MKKKEFLRILDKRIKTKDKEDIINYYDELIEDMMDKNGVSEEEAIDMLEDIDDIVRKANRTDDSKISLEEEKKVATKENDSNALGKVLSIIIFFPLWIVLLSVYFALICAAVGLEVGLGVAGVFSIIYGFISIAVNLNQAIIIIGVGIIVLGVMFIISPIIFKIAKLIFRATKKSFKTISKILVGGN